jgi:hypothetical protein
MVFFEIKFSLFFSFSFRNVNGSERDQSVGNQDQTQDHITLPAVSQQTVEPGSTIKQRVVASAPVRPVLSRFARCFWNESATSGEHEPETDNAPITDTRLAKASDRESLEILLRSSEQREQPATAKVFITDKADELSGSSLVHLSPALSLDTLPEGPFVVRQSTVLESDSGSDLVSSLQRIRIGGLASYFQELEERARARTESSTVACVSGEHDQSLATGLEDDQHVRASDLSDMADGEWSEVTVREASGEE